MSAEEDTELRDLVAQTLEMNGVLNKIRAELRANVFLALEEQDTLQKKSISNKPLKNFLETKDGQLAFSVVREFLQFFNLDFTLAVLDPESDFVGKSSTRENLMNELNLPSVSSTPVLFDIIKRTNEGRTSPPSLKMASKIPQRVSDVKSSRPIDNHKIKDNKNNAEKKLLLQTHDDDDLDNEDDLLKELGVSPISSHNTNKKKPSWLSNEPSNKLLDNHVKTDEKLPPVSGLGSLKNAPPLAGLGKNTSLTQSPLDVTSPEWDDLMKIDQKISELGFEIPKEDTSYKNTKNSLKDSNYDDDDFNASSSQKSDGVSITEEIEDDISIGSFAGSNKDDDILTTDQTVSQISGAGFDYGEDAE